MLKPHGRDDAPAVRFGDFELDLGGGELRRNGQPVRLQRKPFELLCCLVRAHGRLVSGSQLLDRVWPEVVVSPQALTSALRDLRRALGDSCRDRPIIETQRGRGYRLALELREVRAPYSAQPLLCRKCGARLATSVADHGDEPAWS